VGTSHFHRMAAYTRCLRCAGAPRRPASGSGLSLSILSWHTVLSDPGEFDHRQFQRSDVDAAFAESRPARHSQDSRNPFRAGDDFRGFLVRTSATVCQFARPLHGSDRLPSQRGFYIQASSGLVALPAAGYNYNSDWTPLLAGLSPARMAASLAAPTPSSQLTFTTYHLPVPLGALTRVTACTSRCHQCVTRESKAQPLRYLHDCFDCFRLERLPGEACTHRKALPLHGAHPNRTSVDLDQHKLRGAWII